MALWHWWHWWHVNGHWVDFDWTNIEKLDSAKVFPGSAHFEMMQRFIVSMFDHKKIRQQELHTHPGHDKQLGGEELGRKTCWNLKSCTACTKGTFFGATISYPLMQKLLFFFLFPSANCYCQIYHFFHNNVADICSQLPILGF